MPQTVTYDTKYGEQQATVWVATLSYDSLSQAREIMLYGEVAMPISSQDVGVEEFDGRYYLPFETNSVKHNEYVRSRLLWSEEDPKGTYDKTVFFQRRPPQGRTRHERDPHARRGGEHGERPPGDRRNGHPRAGGGHYRALVDLLRGRGRRHAP